MKDPLNIFGEIAAVIKNRLLSAEVYATGSRASSKNGKKWDFDIIVVHDEKETPRYIEDVLKEHFKDCKDEHNNPVKVDVWYVRPELKERFISKINLGKNVKLL